MSELDKKIQKTPVDLVQSVIEAQEKRNPERVDTLVSNAIKQLKMSRFKPDQAACISLIYLARVSPKTFQSTATKDLLKSLLRRDPGPTSMKGGKNDIILPILAANILLACCDSDDVRNIVLNKVEQWLSPTQKIGDMVQQLLITLCMKCQGDENTISALIEMRQYWLQYLEENHETYGSVPRDLCARIRTILLTETNCESLINYLSFLNLHDTDLNGLGADVSKLVLERPLTLQRMFKQELGSRLYLSILGTFTRIFQVPTRGSEGDIKVELKKEAEKEDEKVKKEVSKEEKNVKTELKEEEIPKTELVERETAEGDMEQGPIYVKLPSHSKVMKLSRLIYRAMFTMLTMEVETTADTQRASSGPNCKDEDSCKSEEGTKLIENLEVRVADFLRKYWITGVGKTSRIAPAFEDSDMSMAYDIPEDLRRRLIASTNDLLVELGLRNASPSQLIKLLQQFGLPLTTIRMILKRLDATKNVYIARSDIRDSSLFKQLMIFYSDLGVPEALDVESRFEYPLIKTTT